MGTLVRDVENDVLDDVVVSDGYRVLLVVEEVGVV